MLVDAMNLLLLDFGVRDKLLYQQFSGINIIFVMSVASLCNLQCLCVHPLAILSESFGQLPSNLTEGRDLRFLQV